MQTSSYTRNEPKIGSSSLVEPPRHCHHDADCFYSCFYSCFICIVILRIIILLFFLFLPKISVIPEEWKIMPGAVNRSSGKPGLVFCNIVKLLTIIIVIIYRRYTSDPSILINLETLLFWSGCLFQHFVFLMHWPFLLTRRAWIVQFWKCLMKFFEVGKCLNISLENGG